MEKLLTTQNIEFAIYIIGVIFAVYLYFRKPQEDLDKKQAVNQVAIDGKAEILARQLQWEKESNERKFSEIQISIKDAFTLAQNHTHTVEVKTDRIESKVEDVGKELIKLGTILQERLPNNKNHE